MKRFTVILLFLSVMFITGATVFAEEIPACGGLLQALDKIPPESPGYTKVLEKAQTDCSEALQHAALIALYFSTNGEGWQFNLNWLDETISHCLWYGISCNENGDVTSINLESNQLTGSIPPELGNLLNLETLNLSENQIAGPIPPEIGTLVNLINVNISENQLTGPIPPELGNLTKLTYLRIEDNPFATSIPPEIGSLVSLQQLQCDHCQLTGTIPPELGNLTNLTYLQLSMNQLTGSIPPELGNLTNLRSLFLAYNQLSGCIPSELSNLSNIYNLVLIENYLSGWETQYALDWALNITFFYGPFVVADNCP